mgnify:FL=1
MLRYIFVSLVLFVAGLSAGAVDYTVEQIPNVHVADKTQYVTNPDGILSQEAVGQLNAQLADIWAQSSAEVVAVVVRSIGDAEINDFATRLFEYWGIGKKDTSNGLLILVVEGQRKAVLRTGYGAEGLLPDVICGRIIRDVMAPSFKKGDYDTGMINAVAQIHSIVTTPGAIEELQSKYANDAAAGKKTGMSWKVYSQFAVLLGVLAFLFVLFSSISMAKKDAYERYYRLKQFDLPLLVVTFLSLGAGVFAYGLLRLLLYRCRNKKRVCPNCKAKMHKLSEAEDNKYLTPAQDMEERLNSVDYDVWLCKKCGEVDVFPFINRNTPFQECPVCHAKASMLVADRLIQSSTAYREGRGVKTFKCRNCGNMTNLTYVVPKDEAPVIVPFIGGFGGGRGGDGFGGFGGGSFGGGMTGGGGASGDW